MPLIYVEETMVGPGTWNKRTGVWLDQARPEQDRDAVAGRRGRMFGKHSNQPVQAPSPSCLLKTVEEVTCDDVGLRWAGQSTR